MLNYVFCLQYIETLKKKCKMQQQGAKVQRPDATWSLQRLAKDHRNPQVYTYFMFWSGTNTSQALSGPKNDANMLVYAST